MVCVIYFRVDPGSQCSHFTATQLLKKTVSKFKYVIMHDHFEGLFHFLGGEVGWKFLVVFSTHFSTWLVPWLVSMLVYIDLKSALKSFAPGGSFPWSVRIWIRWLESFRYVGTWWRSFYSQWSNLLLSPAIIVPLVLTTGLVFPKVLCIFAVR